MKKPGYRPSPEEQNQLDAIGRLAAVLGAHLMVEEGDDLAQTVKEVAEEKGSTYVLIGTPTPRTGLDRFRPAAAQPAARRRCPGSICAWSPTAP